MGTPHLTEADRIRVRTLKFDANFTYNRIMDVTGFGIRQIRNALKSATVGKRSGRPTALSKKQEEDLIEFVTASKKNRSMSYQDVAKTLFEGAFGEYAIRNTLRRNGFTRSGPVLKQTVRVDDRDRGAGPASPAGAAPAGGDGQMQGVVPQPETEVGVEVAVPTQGVPEESGDGQMEGCVVRLAEAAVGAAEHAVPTQRVSEGAGGGQIQSVAQPESPAPGAHAENMPIEDQGVAEGSVPREDESRVGDAARAGDRGRVEYLVQAEAGTPGEASVQTPGAVSPASEDIAEDGPSPEAEGRGEDRRSGSAESDLFTEYESGAESPISRQGENPLVVVAAASGNTPGADVLSGRGQTPTGSEGRADDK